MTSPTRYANGMTLMSVSKSLLGLLAGVLVARNDLAPNRSVTDVIPEVTETAYRGATVRHLVDMRAGVAFDEDYLATSGPFGAEATLPDCFRIPRGLDHFRILGPQVFRLMRQPFTSPRLGSTGAPTGLIARRRTGPRGSSREKPE